MWSVLGYLKFTQSAVYVDPESRDKRTIESAESEALRKGKSLRHMGKVMCFAFQEAAGRLPGER